MRSVRVNGSSWSGGASVPALSNMAWTLLAIPAAALVVMAVLQIISFSSFKDWLEGIRVGWPAVIAVAVIVCEILGAVSLLRIPMNPMMRLLGLSLAVLVVGFWFVENLQLVSTGGAGQLPNSGFFGKYLSQSPGWWTVLEASLLLFWIVYAVELFKDRAATRERQI